MKRLFLLISLLAVSVGGFSQESYKIMQKSARNMPKWVNSIEKEYLIVTATAKDIEDAKTVVLKSIKQQIAESVATRIVAETDLSRVDLDVNGRNSYRQQLETSINTQTAKLPFMSEISLSKASDFYWEERYYKHSKRTEVFYAVKYPFSNFEMKKLVLDFQQHNAELDRQLIEYEDNMIVINSIEDISKAITDMNAFLNEFLQADPRYSKVESLINNYRKLYDYITIDAYQAKKGEIVAAMTLNNKPITTQQKPVLKSNCASQLRPSMQGNVLSIKYDDSGCYDEDENYIDISFRVGNKFLKQRVFFKSTLNISLTGIVTDAETGEPVPYAKLTLLPSGKTAATGRNGVYQYNDLPGGNYSVQALHGSYKTNEVNTSVAAKGTSRCDIRLVRKPDAPASPMIVTSETSPVSSTPSDPQSTVRNGLFAYYRFNGNVNDEIGGPAGILVDGAEFVEGGQDGSQVVRLNAAKESYINFPRGMVNSPNDNYSVTFWVKGISDGHIFTSNSGSTDNSMYNLPRLIMTGGKFKLINRYADEVTPFSNGSISYGWHFIAVVTANNTQTLYVDGQLVDRINFQYYSHTTPTKFVFGGRGIENAAAIGMMVDNLRIYNARGLSDVEVAEIYNSEK